MPARRDRRSVPMRVGASSPLAVVHRLAATALSPEALAPGGITCVEADGRAVEAAASPLHSMESPAA